MNYAILAGGHGSRFQREGVMTPKPMVEVGGKPMIERLIEVLQRCGAETIAISANPRLEGFVDFLEGLARRHGNLSVRPIITENSYESLLAATDGLDNRFIAMTCDTIFPVDEFAEYSRRVVGMADDEVVMGLSRYIDDASPLYARIGGNGEIIDYRYGGEPFADGAIVSAGLYGLSRASVEAVRGSDYYPTSLSDFQRTLAVRTPVRVMPYEFSTAFDVDNCHDRVKADEFLSSMKSSGKI